MQSMGMPVRPLYPPRPQTVRLATAVPYAGSVLALLL
jgi:hypothetical protein